MIVGFTGSQTGMTIFQKEEFAKLLELHKCTEIHHGDCIGSDEQANNIAIMAGIKVFSIHPSDIPNKRAFCFDLGKATKHNNIVTEYLSIRGVNVKWYPVKGPLTRNKDIVDACEIIIATPKEFQHTLRSGTWSTIRYAWKTKKANTIIIPPVERPEEKESIT